MSAALRVGPITAERGERAFGYLELAPLAGGGPLRIGVHLLCGDLPGPTLGLLATQHGGEVGPLAALHEIVRSVDTRQLAGNLLVVPVANPIAFLYGQRSSWMDGLYGGTTGNLNRLWPGKQTGFVTERIAYAITEHVLKQCDYVIDYHASEPGGLAIYYAYYMPEDGEVGRIAREMALRFGMEILMRRPGRHTGGGDTLSDFVFQHLRKPVIPVELGDFYGLAPDRPADGPLDPPRSLKEVGVTGTFNVMRYLGMLEGSPRLPRHQVIVSPETRCQPAAGGLLMPEMTTADIGTHLPAGTLLGRVISAHSLEVIDEIRAPYAENLLVSCLYGNPWAKVNPGDQAFHVADLSTAEWIEN